MSLFLLAHNAFGWNYVYGNQWRWEHFGDESALAAADDAFWGPGKVQDVEINGVTYGLRSDGKTCIMYLDDDLVSGKTTLAIPASIQYRGKTYAVTGLYNDIMEEDNNSITSISIPASLEMIYDELPWQFPKLKSFTVASESKFFKAVDDVLYTADGKTLVAWPPAKSGTSFTIPTTVTELADGSFSSKTLTTITLPDGLTELGAETFDDCPKLKYLVIPDGVTILRYIVFDNNNEALSYLVIGNGVFYIDPDFLAWESGWGLEQKLTIYTDNNYVKQWFRSQSSSQFTIKPRSEAPGYVPPKPVAPQPTATTDLSDGVNVTWNASPGASKYKVRRGTTTTYSKSTVLATVTTTSYMDTSAVVGTSYYYWVVPVDSANIEYSDAAKYAVGKRIKVPVVLTPPQPTASSSIVVSWTAVPNAVSYVIRRSVTPDYSASVEVGTVSAPPYIDSTASPDTNYNYWILPRNDSGIAYHDESKYTVGIRTQNPATATIVLKKGWNLCPVSAARLSENSKDELLRRFRLYQYDQFRHAYIHGTLEGYDSFWLYAETPETLVLEIAE
ncbi:MAG: leucine-rich repeat protein [Victivallales bacterium]|nr:leucine-rich repeat protein [Victivallales bacterium]